MPSDTDAGTLRDILRHIGFAESFAQRRRSEGGDDDLMPLYAIIRCLEIISEASRRLSDELKARHPEIRWQDMAAAGNFYRHEYEDVLPQRVWRTLSDDIPELRKMIEDELS